VLRVLSEPTQDKFQDTVFGFAVVPILASVYYDHALRTAKKDNAEYEVPIILGSVIAHEVGHLLLGLEQSHERRSHATAMGTQTGKAGHDGRIAVHSRTVEACSSGSEKTNEFRGGQPQPAAIGKSRLTGQNCGAFRRMIGRGQVWQAGFGFHRCFSGSYGRQRMLCGVRPGMANCAFQIRSS